MNHKIRLKIIKEKIRELENMVNPVVLKILYKTDKGYYLNNKKYKSIDEFKKEFPRAEILIYVPAKKG